MGNTFCTKVKYKYLDTVLKLDGIQIKSINDSVEIDQSLIHGSVPEVLFKKFGNSFSNIKIGFNWIKLKRKNILTNNLDNKKV